MYFCALSILLTFQFLFCNFQFLFTAFLFYVEKVNFIPLRNLIWLALRYIVLCCVAPLSIYMPIYEIICFALIVCFVILVLVIPAPPTLQYTTTKKHNPKGFSEPFAHCFYIFLFFIKNFGFFFCLLVFFHVFLFNNFLALSLTLCSYNQ